MVAWNMGVLPLKCYVKFLPLPQFVFCPYFKFWPIFFCLSFFLSDFTHILRLPIKIFVHTYVFQFPCHAEELLVRTAPILSKDLPQQHLLVHVPTKFVPAPPIYVGRSNFRATGENECYTLHYLSIYIYSSGLAVHPQSEFIINSRSGLGAYL